MSGLEYKYLISELINLKGSRLDKVYQLDRRTFLLSFRAQGRRHLRVSFPDYAYLSSSKPQTPEKPTSLAMLLRKHLSGRRLSDVGQFSLDRIIFLRFDECILYMEFIPPGNLVLVENDRILALTNPREWKDRVLRKGLPYRPPPLSPDPLSLEPFSGEPAFKGVFKRIRFPPKYLEEAFFRAGLKRDGEGLDDEGCRRLKEALADIIGERKFIAYLKDGKVVDFAVCVLHKYSDLDQREFSSISELMEFVLSNLPARGEEVKVEDVKDYVRRHAEELLRKAEEYKRKGDLIYANLGLVEEILSIVRENRHLGEEELNRMLAKYNARVDLKKGKVEIDL